MPDEPYTPQNRTDDDGDAEGGPATTPQGRTDEDEADVEEGRPGGDA